MSGIEFGLHLPSLVLPDWRDVLAGLEYAVLPQIPLTLTNAIIVTAAVSRQLFPRELNAVNERNLSLSTGLMNLFAAPFGGRTATASLFVGLVLLTFGLALGEDAMTVLQAVPEPVLGALLLFSGLELAAASQPQRFKEGDLLVVLVITVIAVASNAAAAFFVGLILAHLFRKGWAKP